jgi:streptogramin lyase
VALKLVAPELADSEPFRRRFLREQELAASIDHPNVLPVYNAGETDGMLWIAMRYVDGIDLRALLARQGPLPPARAVAIAGQVASALDAAHARGLVHRDVKPGNILLAEGAGGIEHGYLADFGLTRHAGAASPLTASGQLVGTVDYVAPEQAEGGSVDGRADQYALACVLFECLTGAVPFRRPTELAVIWAHVHQPPPRLQDVRAGLPEQLDAAVARGLAKAPVDRYPTCTDLATSARDALGPDAKAPVRPEHPARPAAQRPTAGSPRLSRRSTAVVLTVALVVLAGTAVAAGLLVRTDRRAGQGPAALTAAPGTAVRIDAVTGDTAAVVKVGAEPLAVAAGGSLVWVVNDRDASLSEIDPTTNRVQDTVPLPGSGPAGVGGPGLAFGNGTAWILNSVDGTVNRIDAGILRDQISVGESPSSIAVAPNAAWVTSQVKGVAARIDPGSNQVVWKATVGRTLSGVAASPDGSTVWVINHRDKIVTEIDGRKNRVVDQIRLKLAPDQATFGEGAVWVTCTADNAVLRIDPLTRRTEQIAVGDGPTGIAFGAGRVWVANNRDGTVSSIDPLSKAVGTYWLGFRPTAITVDQQAVWVTITS